MKSLRFRPSRTSRFWKLQKSTVIGLGQQASKGGYTATFATSIESLDEDADIIDDISLGGPPFKNNQSTQTQTATSLRNMKNSPDTPKQHGQADDWSIRANSSKAQMETKNIGHISRESQTLHRGAGWDIFRKGFPQATGRHSLIQIPLSSNHLVSNYRSKESNAFAELDSPVVDSEHEKMSTSINRISSSQKEQQISGVPDARMTEVQVARDGDSSKKNIPVRELFASKRDFLLAKARRLSVSKLKFVLEDHLSEEKEEQEEKEKKKLAMKQKEEMEKKKEVAMKQKEEMKKKEVAMKQKEEMKKKEEAMKQKEEMKKKEEAMKQKEEKEKKEEMPMKQKPFNKVRESNSIHGEKSICIEYVPHGISVIDIRKALSVYGDVVGCFLRGGNGGGLPGCHIEFKTTEDKERALSDRWVIVNGKQLSVCRVDFPVTTVVRITNLDPNTALNDVHNICMSYGNLESLQTREDDAVDACFHISESRNLIKILEKLNEVKLNNRRWIARPAPRLSKSLSETPDGQNWAGKQLSNQIENIKKNLRLKRIYLEDLEELHRAIMHIKECPSPLGNGST